MGSQSLGIEDVRARIKELLLAKAVGGFNRRRRKPLEKHQGGMGKDASKKRAVKAETSYGGGKKIES